MSDNTNDKIIVHKTENMYIFTISIDDKIVTYLDMAIKDETINIGSFENIGPKGYGTKIMKYALEYLKSIYNKNLTVTLWVTDHFPSHVHHINPMEYYKKNKHRELEGLRTYYMNVYGFTPILYPNNLLSNIDSILTKLATRGGKYIRKLLDKCTVDELKARALKRGIKVTGLKKAGILAKLRK